MIGYRRIYSFIVAPILKEFPFFFMFFFLFGLPIFGEILYLFQVYSPMVARGLIGRIGLLFLYDYLLTLLIYYSRSKIVKILIYVVVLFLFGINSFLFQNYGYEINMNVLTLILETNGREASEFVDSYLFSTGSIVAYGKVLVRLVIVLVLEFVYNRFVYDKNKSYLKLEIWLALPVVLMFVWGLVSFGAIVRICSHGTSEHFFHQQQIEDIRPKDPISTTMLSLYALHLVGHEMDIAINTTRNLKSVLPADKSDSLDVVLIIGESSNKWHYSIYGYNHDTTPRFSEEARRGNLFVFSDAVSPFSMTSPSMKNFLSCNSLSDDESWAQHPFFPAIFKAARYQVFFWDNQKTVEPDAPYTVSLNSFLYNKDLARLS